MWELGLVTSLFSALVFLINNRYKRYIYKNKKKDSSSKISELDDIFIDGSVHECNDEECQVCEPYNGDE